MRRALPPGLSKVRPVITTPSVLSGVPAEAHVAAAAVALGATVIEKHLTLDRNLPGPDHRASIEPDELAAAIERDLANLKELGQVYRTIFGTHYPAMALVQVVRLVEKAARVEIEATAVIPR